MEISKKPRQVKLASLSKESILAKMGWSLNSNSYFSQNNLEPLSVSSDIRGSYWNVSADFSKPFLWGGVFSIDNSITSSTLDLTSKTTYQFEQGLSYNQNLGKNFLGEKLTRLWRLLKKKLAFKKSRNLIF